MDVSDSYSFHRSTWVADHFSDYKPYGWRCGKCGMGQLRANVQEKNLRNRSNCRFACQLRCTEASCGQTYYAIGTWGKYNKSGLKISIDYSHNDCERWYFPKAFEPSVAFFACAPSTPAAITGGLEEAFKLYWISSAACANAIRKVLDRIMDDQGIPGTILDQRLDIFRQTHPVIAERLRAIKWIGNEGSHQNGLERNDVLDGFELLAAVLSELFPDKSKDQRLNDITNEVNTSKKPRSKK